nr:hypothetical protein CFP56_19526 [Quercus suber]
MERGDSAASELARTDLILQLLTSFKSMLVHAEVAVDADGDADATAEDKSRECWGIASGGPPSMTCLPRGSQPDDAEQLVRGTRTGAHHRRRRRRSDSGPSISRRDEDGGSWMSR